MFSREAGEHAGESPMLDFGQQLSQQNIYPRFNEAVIEKNDILPSAGMLTPLRGENMAPRAPISRQNKTVADTFVVLVLKASQLIGNVFHFALINSKPPTIVSHECFEVNDRS